MLMYIRIDRGEMTKISVYVLHRYCKKCTIQYRKILCAVGSLDLEKKKVEKRGGDVVMLNFAGLLGLARLLRKNARIRELNNITEKIINNCCFCCCISLNNKWIKMYLQI